jgi:hypothetical protein
MLLRRTDKRISPPPSQQHVEGGGEMSDRLTSKTVALSFGLRFDNFLCLAGDVPSHGYTLM